MRQAVVTRRNGAQSPADFEAMREVCYQLVTAASPRTLSRMLIVLQDLAAADDYFDSVTHENDPFETERAAYMAMHDTLIENHYEQFVAIYGDVLVDHDDNPDALIGRIRATYGDSAVFIRKVLDEPERIIRLRLPNRVNA